MISWKLITIDRNNQEVIIDLLAPTSDGFSLKETDSIQFQVSVDNRTPTSQGVPYILLGDVPLELEFHHSSESSSTFISSEPLGHHSSRFFYNFFGESELGLAFIDNNELLFTCTVNILARAENAQLASEMLGFITDNLEDAVSVCFSRSKITGNNDPADSFNFTRLDIIERTISYLTDSLPLFLKEHKHTWKAEMQLSDRGQPTGPDSVHWVLSNLDRLTPAHIEESNLIYNNRSYRLDTLPKESIVSESDVYENRVIHTFLYNISIFLIELKETYKIISTSEQSLSTNEYVRFDHTMKKFAQLALRHKSKHFEKLLASVEQIRKVFAKNIPSRVTNGIQPRMTSYVSKHLHYGQAFRLIEQCNSAPAPAPTFEGNNVLLGLKNLSIVYEVSSLLMLNKSIIDCFGVQLTEKSYRQHNQKFPFGGAEKERPYGEVNNYFSYKNETFNIELLYEPKIFPYSSKSSPGDLVDTSNSRSTAQFGKHHYCPDFVIKINSTRWSRPITIILDAKYKDASTIKKFDIVPLTQKYLLNIHQVNPNGRLGVSPIQLLLVLFAYNRTGNTVRTVASRHSLTGLLPVLPQASAILLHPTNTDLLDEHLKALIEVMDKEES